MISVIFFGSSSSVALIVEFLNSVPRVTFSLIGGILAGSTVWMFIYAKWREDVIEKDAASVREGRWWSYSEVYLFPGFSLFLAFLMGYLAFTT